MTIEKRKRGRPKKEVIRQIETPENIVSDEKDLDDILNNLGNQTDFVSESHEEIKPDEIQNSNPGDIPGTNQNSNPNNFGDNNANEINDAFTELINPEIVISIFNTLIVFTGKLVFKYANIDGNHEELNLTKEEMRLLKPSVSEWLKTLDFKLTPLTAMLLSIGMIYASKIPLAILTKQTDSTPGPRKYTPRKTTGTGKKRGSYKKKTINVNLGN